MISHRRPLISVASLEILFKVSPFKIISAVITAVFPFSLTLFNPGKRYKVFNF